jgi:hypothetical protein
MSRYIQRGKSYISYCVGIDLGRSQLNRRRKIIRITFNWLICCCRNRNIKIELRITRLVCILSISNTILLGYGILSLFFNFNIVIQKIIVSFGLGWRFIFIFIEFKISLSKINFANTHSGIIEMFLSLFLNPSDHVYYCVFKLVKLLAIDREIWKVRY